MLLHIIYLIKILAILSPFAHASEGDAAWSFNVCVWRCNQTGCTEVPNRAPVCGAACPHLNQLPVPLALRMAFWTCEDDCKHLCMLESEAGRRHGTAPDTTLPKIQAHIVNVWKYYGKWPFRRVLGAQEIVSCLLSLGNLIAHVHCCLGLIKLCIRWGYQGEGNLGKRSSVARRENKQQQGRAASDIGGRNGPSASLVQLGEGAVKAYPFLPMWLLYALAHVNAWFWSAIFHVRDTRLTERLDYCSAVLVVGLGLVCVLVRGLGTRTKVVTVGAVVATVALVAWHLRYMLFVKFDYGWNMKFCLGLGLLNSVAWVVFCQSTRHPHRWRLYGFLLLMYSALLLEVLDFPPFFMLVDAHAVWHATTIPLIYLFYYFVHGDVEWFSALRRLRTDKCLS